MTELVPGALCHRPEEKLSSKGVSLTEREVNFRTFCEKLPELLPVRIDSIAPDLLERDKARWPGEERLQKEEVEGFESRLMTR